MTPPEVRPGQASGSEGHTLNDDQNQKTLLDGLGHPSGLSHRPRPLFTLFTWDLPICLV